MTIKRILTLDGGGIRGIIPAVICNRIEQITGKQIFEIFDLISGTSTGSVLGAGLALGIPAEYIVKMYIEHGGSIFNPRTKWFRPWEYLTKPKYNKEPFLNAVNNIYGKDTLLSDTNTKFMCTAYNVLTERNEFFTSWQDRYRNELIVDIVERSMSAPYLFGKYVDKEKKKIYSDGSVGIFNNTPVVAAIESSKLGWDDDYKYILNIGCGIAKKGVSYDTAKNWNNIDEILMYFGRQDHQANDLKKAILNSSIVNNVSLNVINPIIGKDETDIDNVDLIDEYYEYAISCYDEVEKLHFLKDLPK